MQHAEVEVGGYKIPLIGIDKSATEYECDGCHAKSLKVTEIILSEEGNKFLCRKCAYSSAVEQALDKGKVGSSILPTRTTISNMPKFTPLGDRVLVKIENKPTKKGELFIPDSARDIKDKPLEAVVIKVGPGRYNQNNALIPIHITEGERVLVSQFGGIDLKFNDEEYKLFSADDLLGVIG